MNEPENFDTTIRNLESLNEVPPPDPLRKASARRAFLEHAARLRNSRAHNQGGFLPGSFRLAAGGLGAIVLTLGVLTGLVYTADKAKAGDLLYPIDRFSEDFRLNLTQDPTAAVHMLLAIAEERLVESEQLSSEGDLKNMAVALEAYSQTIGIIAQNSDSHGAEGEVLNALIESVLAAQEERLQAIHDQIPASAYPSLEKAIEAVRKAQEKNQPNKDSSTNPSQSGKPGPGQSDSPYAPNAKKNNKSGGALEDNSGNGPPDSLHGPPDGNSGGPPLDIPGNGPPDSPPGQQDGNSTPPEGGNSDHSPKEEKSGGPPEDHGPPN